MEINAQTLPAWLDEKHPNFERWKRGRELSVFRGGFVLSIVSEYRTCKKLTILDLGSGEGGTSKVFSEENFTVSFDISTIRLKRQAKNFGLTNIVCGSSSQLPFKVKSFDLIIIQDVIEHLDHESIKSEKLYDLLKENGIIYLSTPNKYSLFNIISDPHWGFPFVALMKRDLIRKFFLNYFRKNERNRQDIAQLLSLSEINKRFEEKFLIELNTKKSVSELLNENKGIVWSSFHLGLIKILNRLKLQRFILRFANNNFGFVNLFLTPTFYIVMRKK